jgi:tetratricopeptide (TPR) repeat protein
MVHTCNSKHTQYRRMNATVALNNDAISSIRSRKYRKATSLLNRALLKSSYLEIGDSMQVQDDEMEEEETHECEYDEGLTRFPDPLMIPANRVNDPNFVKLVTFYNLGVSHLGSQNNEDALAYFDKALSQNIFLQSLSMNITNDDDNRSDDHTDSYSLCSKDSIALLHNLGHCYFRCQRFAESLEFYNRALELVLQTHGYYHLDVSSTLNCIGVVRLHSLTDKNDTTEILGVFTEALAIVQALLKKDQDQAFYATILNNIGRTRFAREEFQEAKAKYEESYQIRCRIYGQYHVDVAAVLYNAGEVEHLLGNFDEAISLYQKFIHISTSKFGEGHFDIAMAFKKIGQIYYERNETDKSIQMYVKALSAINQSSGENHIESATIMNKIGNICYECKDFDIALGIYEEGLKVERKILDYNHPNIVITLINIARIHHQQGTLDKALELHVEALEIQRSSCSNKSDRLNLACTLSSIGLINDQRKDYWSAIDAFEEALDIRTKELGENHFDVSSTLNVSTYNPYTKPKPVAIILLL